jgi:DNA-binding transcriptional MocR family regulator
MYANLPVEQAMSDAASMQFWRVRVDPAQRPRYRAIADAIAGAIETGALRAGDRLPPQRALAAALGLDLTTVTRGYAEVRRRGLLDATVGRGSFVSRGGWAPPPGSPPPVVDLSMNLPPQPLDPPLLALLRDGLDALLRQADSAALMTYHPAGGAPHDREAGAAWLQPVLGMMDPPRTLACTGAQCALTALLTLLAQPGDRILVEPLAYPPLRALAAQLRLRLRPVATDADGLLPDALDAACRDGAAAICLTPTMQNPTTATMPPARREAVAAVALRHRVPIIEDDAYGRLPRVPLPALARFAPAATWYVATLSKCLSPGLRIAYVVAPDAAEAARLEAAVRATSLMPPPLMLGLVSGWIRQGTAAALCEGVRREIAARQEMARAMLPAAAIRAHPEGPHLWLTLPPRWHPMAFAALLRGRGLALAPSAPFVVAGPPPNAVRLGLGAAQSQAVLHGALAAVAAALQAEPPPDLSEIV